MTLHPAFSLITALCLSMTIVTGLAADNLIENGGFELPVVPDGSLETYFAPASFPGWNVEFGGLDITDTSFFSSAEGKQSVDLNALDSGGVYQDVVTMPGESYRLRFKFGANTVRIGNPETMPLVKVMEVLWGTNSLATLSLDVTGLSPTDAGWQEYSYIVTGSGSDRVTFRSLSGGHAGPAVDEVSLASLIHTVTNLADSGPGTLRQAIADALPGDVIDFGVTGTITLTSGELVVTNDLSLIGPGATNLTVSGNNSHSVFVISSGIVELSGMTIANGMTAGTGAGINNSGTLTLSSCVVCSNSSTWKYHGGGGIANSGSMTIRSCRISDNYAEGSGGGVLGLYGSLFIHDSTINNNCSPNGGGIRGGWGSTEIVNTTISGNSAGWGGGVISGENTILRHCTITQNAAWWSYGGGIVVDGTAEISGSIVANNFALQFATVPDCAGILNSKDYNLIGDTNGCTITNLTAHNIYGQDPLLGSLADNGGLTPTHALLLGSPAIDRGTSGGITTDQRGMPRTFNFPAYLDIADGTDIGAYELQERAQTGPLFTVNSIGDTDDGVPGIAHCSLREAIAAANVTPGTNTITFAGAVRDIMEGVAGTIVLTNGELVITNDLNIIGPGATNLIVAGNRASRVLHITRGSVQLSGLTIADGWVPAEGEWSVGGGILNEGNLMISDCWIRDCEGGYGGGGVANRQTLTMTRCTLSSNNGAAGAGGGINNLGWLAATNCTISRNVANSGAGGIYVGDAAIAILQSCTVSSNSTHFLTSPGGILAIGGAVSLQGTIVARNFGAGPTDVETRSGGLFSSGDFNLIGNTNGMTTTGVTTHNIYGQDPLLGPLAYNGGPTPTHALRFDSPAIDAGRSSGLTMDQRGLPRVIDDPGAPNAEGGDGSDIGAFEADPLLRFTSIKKSGGNVELTFSSMFDRYYRLEWASDLAGPWNVLTNGVPGTGSYLQALDAGGATEPKRFYRGVLLSD